MAIMKVVLVGLLAVLASAVADDQEDSIHFEVIFEACNFEDADSDKDGFATVADFQVLMKDAGLGDDEKDFYRKLLVTADTNKDGKLNKEEYDAAVFKYSQFQPAHLQTEEQDKNEDGDQEEDMDEDSDDDQKDHKEAADADKEAAEANKDGKVNKEESDSAVSESEPSFLQTEEQDENEDKDEEEDKVENDDALPAAVEEDGIDSEPSLVQIEEQGA
eukprot:TRINITY_DN632_c1_g1_i5.p1 TRINITY_DN632_c1_g1~~TRINITY_DN632_c1_g1_i5.p1  ORF type:complete len:218 (-),score=107.68 TRINITY_DN632_c1_g1_i5:285-938(-)